MRNALRSIGNKFVTCRNCGAQTIIPIMADLPEERLDASTAFTSIGVDYFGAVIVKIGRKNKKRWLLFVHMSNCESGAHRSGTKLGTDSCVNGIFRIIARRGKPSTIISQRLQDKIFWSST